MGRTEKPAITFVIDSREQFAYHFSKPKRRELADGGEVTYGLDEGDYACELDGELLPIRIERKSLGDLFGVVGHGRERFEREMERLARHERAYLLIEASLAEVKSGYERSLVTGEAALGSVLHWSTQFGVQPVFAGNRRLGNEVCQRILEDFSVHHALGC
jgi:ERCC4-type nuclease